MHVQHRLLGIEKICNLSFYRRLEESYDYATAVTTEDFGFLLWFVIFVRSRNVTW